MSKRILIVDDEPEIVELVESRLLSNGFEVLKSYDGADGLVKATKNHPDLIILDIGMPKMNGCYFIREMKLSDELKNIPVLILTAKGDLEDLFKIEGVKEYMVKPFNSDELVEKVKELVGV